MKRENFVQRPYKPNPGRAMMRNRLELRVLVTQNMIDRLNEHAKGRNITVPAAMRELISVGLNCWFIETEPELDQGHSSRQTEVQTTSKEPSRPLEPSHTDRGSST